MIRKQICNGEQKTGLSKVCVYKLVLTCPAFLCRLLSNSALGLCHKCFMYQVLSGFPLQ